MAENEILGFTKIPQNTIEQYGITNNGNQLVFPTTDNSKIFVNLNNGMFVSEGGGIFNSEALENTHTPTFITTNPIDALTINYLGGQALAVGKPENLSQSLLPLLQDYRRKAKGYYPKLILLKNDFTNRLKTQSYMTFEKCLDDDNFQFCERTIVNSAQQVNELLISNVEQLTKDINDIAKYPDGQLEAFEEALAYNDTHPAIKTGYKHLNENLGGGLREGIYVIGALPSFGKTTFCLQSADYIAQYEHHPVLYFSLEMTQASMIARLISRLSYELAEDKDMAVSSQEALDGVWEKHFNDQSIIDNLNEAKDRLKQYISNLQIVAGPKTAQNVYKEVESFIKRTGKKPVVFIDYLQEMPAEKDDDTDKQKISKNTSTMKEIATDFHLPVIVISSLNRQSYKVGTVIEALKESGDIEYKADVIAMLAQWDANDSKWTAAGPKYAHRLEAFKRQSRRPMGLFILKNRNGQTGHSCYFNYLPRYNKFETGSLDKFQQKFGEKDDSRGGEKNKSKKNEVPKNIMDVLEKNKKTHQLSLTGDDNNE